MKKIIILLSVALLLGVCGVVAYFYVNQDKINETDYTMSVAESNAEISIALNDLMLCKGMAMTGRAKETVESCFHSYLNKYGAGSLADIAEKEYFDRGKKSQKFKESHQSLAILKKIGMKQDAFIYVDTWLKKQP